MTGECMKMGAVEPSPLAAAAAQLPPRQPERRPVRSSLAASCQRSTAACCRGTTARSEPAAADGK